MATSTQWQLAREAAERYEQILVPTILGPFARALTERSNLQPGETVLDAGCGTGAAARVAVQLVGPTGTVIGIDINEGMLAVAQSLSLPAGAVINWRKSSIYQAPLADETVDVVLCAQVLQFLTQRSQALMEMRRVLKPKGRVALSLWCDLEENPYFHALVNAITRHIGAETAAGLGAAFALTNPDEIRALLTAANLYVMEMATIQLELSLPPMEQFVPQHISATPMATGFQAAPARQQQAVVHEVTHWLTQFAAGDHWRIPFCSQLVWGMKG